jgi:hypothetical protein
MILTRQRQFVFNTEEDRNYIIGKYMKKTNQSLSETFYNLTGIILRPRMSNLFCYE